MPDTVSNLAKALGTKDDRIWFYKDDPTVFYRIHNGRRQMMHVNVGVWRNVSDEDQLTAFINNRNTMTFLSELTPAEFQLAEGLKVEYITRGIGSKWVKLWELCPGYDNGNWYGEGNIAEVPADRFPSVLEGTRITVHAGSIDAKRRFLDCVRSKKRYILWRIIDRKKHLNR